MLVDLCMEMKSGSLYIEAYRNASLLSHVSQQTRVCIRDILIRTVVSHDLLSNCLSGPYNIYCAARSNSARKHAL